MKKIFCILFLIASSCFSATYVGSVSNVWPNYATDDELAALQAEFDSLLSTNGITLEFADLRYVQTNNTRFIATVTNNQTGVSFGAITNVNTIQLNTNFVDGHEVGRLQWNDDDKTIELGLGGGNVNLQVGLETVFLGLNKTGATITNGTPVYISGAQGQRVTIAPADADGAGNASRAVGIVTETITNNFAGYVTTEGVVRDLNTSAFLDGAELFISTNAGTFTTNHPAPPIDAVSIGFVRNSHITQGEIQVHPVPCFHWADMDTRYYQDYDNAILSNLTITGNVTLTNTVWDDMNLSALQLNSGGAAPELRVYTNGSLVGSGVRAVNYDSGDSAFGQIQFSHRKKRNTDTHPHIHWSTIDDRSAVTNISFRLDCFYGRIRGQLTNTYSDTITVRGTNAFYHQLSSFAGFGASNLYESSIVHFEITCLEDGGANDKLFIHDIDFHFQIDKIGSNNELPDGL